MSRLPVPHKTPMLERGEDWRANAVCATSPRSWDTDHGINPGAVTGCQTCPALNDCRTWVLGPGFEGTQGQGVIAGMTPHERHEIVTRAQREACKECGKPIADKTPTMLTHADCRKAWQKRRYAEKQRYGGVTCLDCGTITTNRNYCPACTTARKKASQKRRNTRNRQAYERAKK